MTALNGTIPLTQMTNSSITATGNLFFYMSWLFYELFHVDAVILKRCSCFGLCCVVSSFQFTLFPNYTHSFSSATCSSFENYGITHILCYTFCFIYTVQQTFTTRNYRY